MRKPPISIREPSGAHSTYDPATEHQGEHLGSPRGGVPQIDHEGHDVDLRRCHRDATADACGADEAMQGTGGHCKWTLWIPADACWGLAGINGGPPIQDCRERQHGAEGQQREVA